jgi:hypothetical protein
LVQGDSARRVGAFAEILVNDLSSAGISASIGAACTESRDYKTRAAVYLLTPLPKPPINAAIAHPSALTPLHENAPAQADPST